MCEVEGVCEGVCEVEDVCEDVCEIEGVCDQEEEECSPAHVYVYDENTELMQGVAEEQEVETEIVETGNIHTQSHCCVRGVANLHHFTPIFFR